MDPELVLRAQQGDEAAFAQIAQSVYRRYLQVSYRILRDRHLAEDASQQALVRLWQQLPRLRDPGRFDAWSYRVLSNVCLTELERRSRRTTLPLLIDLPGQADEIARVSDRDQLERAFGRLTAEQRVVVVLHHHVGMTTVEVADALGIPHGTVASRLARAMSGLRQALVIDRAVEPSPQREPTR
jgi:RNA polymerase sigma-70 factor, ECF subfamily